MKLGPFRLKAFELGDREREYKLLLGLVFIFGFSWALVFPVLPLYAGLLGASPVMIGLIMAFPSIFQILLCIPGGVLASRLGKRWVFRLSLSLGAVAALIYYVAPHYGWLFLAQFFFGTSNAIFWPSQGAYLGDLASPKDQGQLIGFTLGLNAVTFILGPLVAGFLMDAVQPNTMFIVYLVAMAVGGLVAYQLPRPKAEIPGWRGFKPISLLRDSASEAGYLFTNPTVQFAVVGSWLMFVVWGVFDAFYPLHVQDLGFSASVLGLLLMGRSAVMGGLRFGGGPLARRFGVEQLMLWGLGGGSLALALLSIGDSPVVLFGATLLAGVGPGLVPVATTTLIASVLDERHRPVGMGLNETAIGVGRLSGSSVFGYVTEVGGAGLSFALAGSLVFVSTIALALRSGRLSLARYRRGGILLRRGRAS